MVLKQAVKSEMICEIEHSEVKCKGKQNWNLISGTDLFVIGKWWMKKNRKENTIIGNKMYLANNEF